MSSLFKNIKIAGSKRDEVLVNCPFCVKKGKSADTGQHLYINMHSNRYICHRCNSHGLNIYQVIPELKYDDEFARQDLLEYFQKEPKQYFDLDAMTKPLSTSAIIYLKKRNINEDQIHKYQIREGIDKYRNRVLIPNFELGTGKCDFFVGRAIQKTARVRYMNPTTSRSQILMNYSNVMESPITFVTEGWFTGYSFGSNFVCYLGSYISKAQSMKISELREVFYAPDGDVSFELIMQNLATILRFRRKVWLVPIPRVPKLDAEDIGVENRRKAFNSSRLFYTKDLTITEKELIAWYESIFPTKT